MDIILKSEWGGRPATKITTTTWDKKTEFIVHYSGSSRSQTIKSIQNYCMDVKGHSDIDYCFVVKDGLIYEGRGWLNIGSHTLGHNTVGIGVCVVGRDGDATEADRRAVRWLYDEACRRAKRQLKKLSHRTANPGSTDCPGNELAKWVAVGMPVTSTTPTQGEEMTPQDLQAVKSTIWHTDVDSDEDREISAGSALLRTHDDVKAQKAIIEQLNNKVDALAVMVQQIVSSLPGSNTPESVTFNYPAGEIVATKVTK